MKSRISLQCNRNRTKIALHMLLLQILLLIFLLVLPSSGEVQVERDGKPSTVENYRSKNDSVDGDKSNRDNHIQTGKSSYGNNNDVDTKDQEQLKHLFGEKEAFEEMRQNPEDNNGDSKKENPDLLEFRRLEEEAQTEVDSMGLRWLRGPKGERDGDKRKLHPRSQSWTSNRHRSINGEISNLRYATNNRYIANFIWIPPPTPSPTVAPVPTDSPTTPVPTDSPTHTPTLRPSKRPNERPTRSNRRPNSGTPPSTTSAPTVAPTTSAPTTLSPTSVSTLSNSFPTEFPTFGGTAAPTDTFSPTATLYPTFSPTFAD